MKSDYFMMIVGVYVTLGAFLINAARNPDANRSLIWFAAVSSLVHSVIMGIQSFGTSNGMNHMGHLAGDVPALLLVAVVLSLLMWMPNKAAETVEVGCGTSPQKRCKHRSLQGWNYPIWCNAASNKLDRFG